MKTKILKIVERYIDDPHQAINARNELLNLFSVSNSDAKERTRFQKDIDDCYAHEDEEENEAAVCLHPAYVIIGCHYNDGRTCDGCNYKPKQTDY